MGGFGSIADQIFMPDCVAHCVGFSLAYRAFIVVYPVAFLD